MATIFLMAMAFLVALSMLSLAGSATKFVAAYEKAHAWSNR